MDESENDAGCSSSEEKKFSSGSLGGADGARPKQVTVTQPGTNKAKPTSKKKGSIQADLVYYHLGSFEDSLTFALGAGSLFDVNHNTEYVETIISKCIDYYTKLRIENSTGSDKKVIDSRLESIVNRMFQRCFDDGQYKQAIGIALETHRMDIFEKAILLFNLKSDEKSLNEIDACKNHLNESFLTHK
ncbi:26S proteasome non-ATPase regulatory subunit 1 [Nymphon striatum]|nr:26S proteasome non-ATPase regulatory subunit 1 [Nymphon striatum]